MLKTERKKLNEKFSDIRNRSHKRKIINKIFRIFKGLKSFMKIHVRKRNRRRYIINFKKLLIIWLTIESNERARNFLIYFMKLICLADLGWPVKPRSQKHKMKQISHTSKSKIFKWKKYFVNSFKDNFQRDGGIE